MVHTKFFSNILLVSIRIGSGILSNFFRHLRCQLRAPRRRSLLSGLSIKLISEIIQFVEIILFCDLPHTIPHFRYSEFVSH